MQATQLLYIIAYFHVRRENILVTFSPTCNEPAETEEVQEGDADGAHGGDPGPLPVGHDVGHRQREEGGRSQHYQVDGEDRLYWTSL